MKFLEIVPTNENLLSFFLTIVIVIALYPLLKLIFGEKSVEINVKTTDDTPDDELPAEFSKIVNNEPGDEWSSEELVVASYVALFPEALDTLTLTKGEIAKCLNRGENAFNVQLSKIRHAYGLRVDEADKSKQYKPTPKKLSSVLDELLVEESYINLRDLALEILLQSVTNENADIRTKLILAATA